MILTCIYDTLHILSFNLNKTIINTLIINLLTCFSFNLNIEFILFLFLPLESNQFIISQTC